MAELTVPVRGVLPATDTPLSGIGQIGYGITVGSTGANEDWLVEGGTQGGIWTLTTPANTWARRSDLDTSGEFANMPSVRVREGNQGIAGSVWYYSGPSAPSIGADDLTFTLQGRGDPPEAGLGLEDNYPFVQIPQRTLDTRYLIGGTKKFDDFGLLEYADIWAPTMRHIRGLIPTYNNTTTIVATPGEAYIPDADGIVVSDPNAAFEFHSAPAITLAANTLYYAYFYSTISTMQGAIEMSATEPDYMSLLGAQYASFPGRQKLGSESRRYIGFGGRTNGSSTLYKFRILPLGDSTLLVEYLENINASPFLIVSGGTAQTAQTVNLGPSGLKLVPATCQEVYLKVDVNATASVVFSNSEAALTFSNTNYLRRVGISQRGDYIFLPLDSNQSFTWMNNVAGGSTDIALLSFIERR